MFLDACRDNPFRRHGAATTRTNSGDAKPTLSQ
jgi:hypothetical protein